MAYLLPLAPLAFDSMTSPSSIHWKPGAVSSRVVFVARPMTEWSDPKTNPAW